MELGMEIIDNYLHNFNNINNIITILQVSVR